MNSIELLNKIDKKIDLANKYLPSLLNIFHNYGITFSYRIKDRKRIFEKVLLWRSNPKYQSLSTSALLDNICDIIGITIVVEQLDFVYDMEKSIRELLESHGVGFLNSISHIGDKTGLTGYECIILTFYEESGIPFEIQITDAKNLEIRQNTHNEFEERKYAKVRNQLRNDDWINTKLGSSHSLK